MILVDKEIRIILMINLIFNLILVGYIIIGNSEFINVYIEPIVRYFEGIYI
jgi:hypothetical protein